MKAATPTLGGREPHPLGYSVPTIKSPKTPNAKTPSESVQSIETTEGWDDKPTIPDQIDTPEYWKSDGIEAKVFDLSKADELSEYNKILSEIELPGTNKFLRDHKIEAFPALGTWKVFIVIQKVKYRKLILKQSDK